MNHQFDIATILLEINNKRPDLPPLLLDNDLSAEAQRQAQNIHEHSKFLLSDDYKTSQYSFSIAAYGYDGFNMFVPEDILMSEFESVGIGKTGELYVIAMAKAKLNVKTDKSEPMNWLAELLKPVIEWFWK